MGTSCSVVVTFTVNVLACFVMCRCVYVRVFVMLVSFYNIGTWFIMLYFTVFLDLWSLVLVASNFNATLCYIMLSACIFKHNIGLH
jgi:hypothetical protein